MADTKLRVKFNKSLVYANAVTASTQNPGTLYFPTDKNVIVLNGQVVGQKNEVSLPDNQTTVGSTTTPVYINAGTVTASTASVGSDSKTLVYLNSGKFTESTTTVGSAAKPVYLSGGKITQLSSTVGGTNQAVYLSAGEIKAFGSSSALGSSTKPIYIDGNGKFAAGTQLGAAATRGVDSSITSSNISSTSLPTTQAVAGYVASQISEFQSAAQAVRYTGTFNADTGLITSLVSDWAESEYIAVGNRLWPEGDSEETSVEWVELPDNEIRGMIFVANVAGEWPLGGGNLEVGDSIMITGYNPGDGESESSLSYIVIQTNIETATTSKSGIVRVVSSASTSTSTNDVYNVTGANAKISSAITSAIQALDVTTSGAGASKTLTALSETDGKISATFGNISITKSQVSDLKDATSSAAGLVKLGSDTVQSVAANAVTATASKTYAIQKNSSGQMVVNVPWSDTTYTLPAATSSVRGGLKIGFSSQDDTTNSKYLAALQLSSEKGYVAIPYATTSQAGVMSKADKTLLNELDNALVWQ